MAFLCSLQGLQPGVTGLRLCSLQSLDEMQAFVNQYEMPDALENNENMNPDIFDNLSNDDEDQNIDDIKTYLAGDMDIHEDILPTDSITVRNQLLLETRDIHEDILPTDSITVRNHTIPYYKSIKVNLKKVIKVKKDSKIIVDIVNRVHVLKQICTHILKLYIVKKRSIDANLKDFRHIISKQFIINLIDVIAKLREIITPVATSSAGRNRKPPARFSDYVSTNTFNYYNTVEKNAEKHEILKFILEFVVPGNELLSIFHGIDIRNLQNVISAMAEEIVKSYHQNIVSNYKSYVDKYVNSFYLNGLDYEKEEIETSKSLTKEQKTTLKNELYKKFRLLKTDLIEPDRSKHQSVDPFAISFIQANQPIIFPKSR